jgi:hypothetical protein
VAPLFLLQWQSRRGAYSVQKYKTVDSQHPQTSINLFNGSTLLFSRYTSYTLGIELPSPVRLHPAFWTIIVRGQDGCCKGNKIWQGCSRYTPSIGAALLFTPP